MQSMQVGKGIVALAVGLAVVGSACAESKVTLLRVPDGGIQPQCMVDAKGVLHLIYFKGEPAGGDVFYVRSEDAGRNFSKPLRVNSKPHSVIAIGNVRGAHLALGKNARVHVAWMGSSKAEPLGPDKQTPLLYTRLNDEGTAFEPQRNVIRSAYGLDGGASLAADASGSVAVVWHAPDPGKRGEDNRCVWIARSKDEGKTFAAEERAFAEATGACGCCGMRAFADAKGCIYVLYRSAKEGVHRDMYLLTSADNGGPFRGTKVHEWNIDTCMMSTAAFGQAGDSMLCAWETEERVYGAHWDPALRKLSPLVATPIKSKPAKHPAVAGNRNGEFVMAWTEGMGWNRGGALAWQVYGPDGKPRGECSRVDGVPVWSLVAVCARPDGGFTIIY